ncbi:MAG: hypothetical protein FJ296_01020 [Planctomycetes bacterium]|nr:hypothetical protein [Planctomycetota bacterium]
MTRSIACRLASLALLLALATPACVVIDVTADHEAGGLKSTGLIGGYATAGWPCDDSLMKLGLLDGRNDGAIFLLQVWKLLRVEVGLLGLAVGLGPLDAGVGILFYDPEPPAYCQDDCGHCDDGEDCGDACHDACESTGRPCECDDGEDEDDD